MQNTNRFFNEIRFKQLIGILKNSRENYRYALCGKSVHPIIYDVSRTYNPLDWHKLILELPHMARDGVSMAYYRQELDLGKKVTTCKIGKYIKRHFPTIPDNIIRDYVNPYIIETEILDNIDNIVDLMVSGDMPSSCMTKDFTIHPYRVYNPDYGWKMVIKKSGDNILGRALINNMHYVRAYTNSTTSDSGMSIDCALESWLDSQGYENIGKWPNGTKIAKIENRNGEIVAPYIDGSNDNLNDCGSYFTLCSDGDYTASNTNGLAEHANSCRCDRCGDRMHEDESNWIESEDRSICEDCLNRHYVYISETRCGSRYIGGYYHATDNCIETIDNEYYPDDSYSDFDIIELANGDYCKIDDAINVDDEYYHVDDLGIVFVELHDGDYALIDDCRELHNGEYALIDDCQELHNGDYALIDDTILLFNGDYALKSDIGTIVFENNGIFELSQIELI